MRHVGIPPMEKSETRKPWTVHSLNPPPGEEIAKRRVVKYVRDLAQIKELKEEEREQLDAVARKYVFRANEYYLSLINWDDPNDPIRRLVVPQEGELEDWGELDASSEKSYTVAPGCQHKYPRVALLLVNEVCGAFCRFCFRKRLFMKGNDEVVNDMSPGIEYIRAHPQITNVLLTGGDPLLLSTRKLERIIEQVAAIPHVGIIRIGTKMPAFNPFRILDDPSLLDMIHRYSTPDRRLYMMLHFNHPRELTDEARAAIDQLIKAGAILCNQTPLLKGINDDPEVLGELLRHLSFVGVPPYYVFQCRPTVGNKPFEVPLTQGFSIFEQARSRVGGLAKRGRYVMSHKTGKIEMIAMDDDLIYMRYHRALNPEDESKLMIFRRDDSAYWFDDLVAAREASGKK
jgi:KamA family protein